VLDGGVSRSEVQCWRDSAATSNGLPAPSAGGRSRAASTAPRNDDGGGGGGGGGGFGAIDSPHPPPEVIPLNGSSSSAAGGQTGADPRALLGLSALEYLRAAEARAADPGRGGGDEAGRDGETVEEYVMRR
jgi:hypothetical protein